MEHKFSASVDRVYELITDPKWLQERSKAMGELKSVCKKAKKGSGLTVSMDRTVHRELPALIAKVLNPDSAIVLVEQWEPTDEGYRASMAMDIVGKPVKVSAEIELVSAGKGCVYRIEHKCKASIPLVGGPLEKFVLGQTVQGCADELEYLATFLKSRK